MRVMWIVEAEVFPEELEVLRALGVNVKPWSSAWDPDAPPSFDGAAVIFRGSLGLADRLARNTSAAWRPGAFCRTQAFACSAWYPRAAKWSAQSDWLFTTASDFVADAESIYARFDATSLFVRPDSPLKPFSGRVVEASRVSLAALDHGFYYDDETIPVVVCPTKTIGDEYRFVVVARSVIAGSGYIADGRAAHDDVSGLSEARALAERIAREMEPPEPVYVLDICATPDGMRLMELNPFSGADLYGCDRGAVVEAVGAWLVASASK